MFDDRGGEATWSFLQCQQLQQQQRPFLYEYAYSLACVPVAFLLAPNQSAIYMLDLFSLSVKAPNGSLDNANEPIRDEELG